jgi:hypothetical protein
LIEFKANDEDVVQINYEKIQWKIFKEKIAEDLKTSSSGGYREIYCLQWVLNKGRRDAEADLVWGQQGYLTNNPSD